VWGWVSLAASFAVLADDPRGWLERMERALATRNYQGTFVHEQDGKSETLMVVHRVNGNEIAERIASLDGSGREVIRHNGELTAYFPDQRVVMVESGPKEGLLLTELLRLDKRVE
jgi:negative regulator of sigma E activity